MNKNATKNNLINKKDDDIARRVVSEASLISTRNKNNGIFILLLIFQIEADKHSNLDKELLNDSNESDNKPSTF